MQISINIAIRVANFSVVIIRKTKLKTCQKTNTITNHFKLKVCLKSEKVSNACNIDGIPIMTINKIRKLLS